MEKNNDCIFEDCTWPGLLIGYNEDTAEFSVASAYTQCGYFVRRADLVGDYRNFGEVVAKILPTSDEVFSQSMPDPESPVYMVLFDESARKEINKIWEANIQLF